MDRVPKSLVVIGGDVMGVELAEAFHALGADVKILETKPSILSSFDADLGRTAQRILRKRGIEIYTNVEMEKVWSEGDGRIRVRATSSGSQLDFTVEKVLLTHRGKPFTEGLGLEKVGVQLKDGFIVTDKHMRTNVSGVYAVGDVTGGKMFAHKALAEGMVAAENAAGMESSMDYKRIPMCVYTSPEIASVGLSEEEAAELGYKVSVGKFPLMANGRALTLGETDGFVKIVSDSETDEILGVHIMSPNATDLIGEAAVALRLECTAEELGRVIHAHPTLSEGMMEAALAVSKRAIHM